jgi:hypothetical protein
LEFSLLFLQAVASVLWRVGKPSVSVEFRWALAHPSSTLVTLFIRSITFGGQFRWRGLLRFMWLSLEDRLHQWREPGAVRRVHDLWKAGKVILVESEGTWSYSKDCSSPEEGAAPHTLHPGEGRALIASTAIWERGRIRDLPKKGVFWRTTSPYTAGR